MHAGNNKHSETRAVKLEKVLNLILKSDHREVRERTFIYDR